MLNQNLKPFALSYHGHNELGFVLSKFALVMFSEIQHLTVFLVFLFSVLQIVYAKISQTATG